MQYDWSLHFLQRIAEASEAQVENSARARKDIRAMRTDLHDLLAWVKRIALALALWGSAATTVLTSDQIADVIVAVLRGLLKLP